MDNSYKTPYDGSRQLPSENNTKRYATAAIVIGGVLAGSSLLAGYASRPAVNTGMPFNYGGRQYYLPNDSRRAVYPSKEACMRDVPPARQGECEPVSSYRTGATGQPLTSWYGPVYNPRDTYQPSPQYNSESASGSNVGKKLPGGASEHGFGSNGKALSGSKGS